jgi:hypothetical protein
MTGEQEFNFGSLLLSVVCAAGLIYLKEME